jgi:chemotaxis protein MotB
MATGKGGQAPIIIIRKVKKNKRAAHHGGAWKVAYADFVTALMAFFMLLWLISNPDKAQLKGLADYFSPVTMDSSPATTMTQNPGSQPGLGGRTRNAQAADIDPIGQPSAEAGVKGAARGGTASVPEAALRVMAEEMRLSIMPPSTPVDTQANVKIEQTREGLRIHLTDSSNRSMFRGGTAELNDFARQMLHTVAKKLSGTRARVAIEGHTDSSGGQSDANWRLSAQRALAARSALVAGGLTPDRFGEVVAKAGSEPVYPDRPDLPENRRITIIILAEPSALPRDASFKF